jgi:CheY-like chemotaxis protein
VVVVLDIQRPDLDGFEIARRLAQAGNPPVIVLVSSRDSSAYRRQLARGYFGLRLRADELVTLPTAWRCLQLEVPGARLDRCETLSSGTVLSLLRTSDLARAG